MAQISTVREELEDLDRALEELEELEEEPLVATAELRKNRTFASAVLHNAVVLYSLQYFIKSMEEAVRFASKNSFLKTLGVTIFAIIDVSVSQFIIDTIKTMSFGGQKCRIILAAVFCHAINRVVKQPIVSWLYNLASYRKIRQTNSMPSFKRGFSNLLTDIYNLRNAYKDQRARVFVKAFFSSLFIQCLYLINDISKSGDIAHHNGVLSVTTNGKLWMPKGFISEISPFLCCLVNLTPVIEQHYSNKYPHNLQETAKKSTP